MPAKKSPAKKAPAKKTPPKKTPAKKTPARRVQPKRPGRPVLVEYLLKLVWDEPEYAALTSGGERAIRAMKDAGLSPRQRTAVLEAVKGNAAALKVAVHEECDRPYGPGDKLWNVAADFIFGHGTPSHGGSTGT